MRRTSLKLALRDILQCRAISVTFGAKQTSSGGRNAQLRSIMTLRVKSHLSRYSIRSTCIGRSSRFGCEPSTCPMKGG